MDYANAILVAKPLIRAILNRYHKTRMAEDSAEDFILRDPEIKQLLGHFVQQVNFLRPSASSTAPERFESTMQELRAKLAATARYITHSSDCRVSTAESYLCSCGASAAARDAYAAQIPKESAE